MSDVVVFRKFRNGEVIAIFPEIPGTANPYTCQSFVHHGQHGACDPLIVNDTAPASPAEYADLAKELQGRGYRLRICKRIQRQQSLAVRRKLLEGKSNAHN